MTADEPFYCRNVKGPSELKLSLTVSPTMLTSELKAKINEQTQIEVERQRLIYSGKVRLPQVMIKIVFSTN